MPKVKVRTKSKTLYKSLRATGLKKKKAAKVANSFDAYGRDERTVQRREAGRKGGQATARKTSAKRAGRTGGEATARKKTARRSKRTTAPKRGTKKR
jgi:hypothetical protein